MSKAVVVLEVMWDWRNVTTSAGYKTTAPRWFDINPKNFTGRRLHQWLKGYDFKVTNACPQLVSSAKGRGKPDSVWLNENLKLLQPFDLLMVCGRVAASTYDKSLIPHGTRIIEMPHPAARMWNRQGLDLVLEVVHTREESGSVWRYDPATSFVFEPWGPTNENTHS